MSMGDVEATIWEGQGEHISLTEDDPVVDTDMPGMGGRTIEGVAGYIYGRDEALWWHVLDQRSGDAAAPNADVEELQVWVRVGHGGQVWDQMGCAVLGVVRFRTSWAKGLVPESVGVMATGMEHGVFSSVVLSLCY